MIITPVFSSFYFADCIVLFFSIPDGVDRSAHGPAGLFGDAGYVGQRGNIGYEL